MSLDFGLAYGLDQNNLEESGWGLLMSIDIDPQDRDRILEALKPLIELRESQAGRVFRLFAGREGGGVFPGETASQFLERFGARIGSVDPNIMPYYLLIAAPPSQIPFSFQEHIGRDRAVGRIWFERPEDWHNYALSVVRAEKESFDLKQDISFFCPVHADDIFTKQIYTLIQALSQRLEMEFSDWEINLIERESAYKSELISMLEEGAPQVLFTAGHALIYPPDNPRLTAAQGGLVCADWPGPKNWARPIPEEMCFLADDVIDQVDLSGRLILQYSSFSLGTPELDSLLTLDQTYQKLAPQPTLARLPQRLLSLPDGHGALAVIGWNDRIWGSTSLDELPLFGSSLRDFFNGGLAGASFEDFQVRYAELATGITDSLYEVQFDVQTDEPLLVDSWVGMENARGMAIFGDPAVRLPEPSPPPIEEALEAPFEVIIEEGKDWGPSDISVSEDVREMKMSFTRRGIDEYMIDLEFGNAIARASFQIDFELLLSAEIDPALYGRLLFEKTLGIPNIYKQYRAMQEYANISDRLLSLRLVIDESAPELHGLRWESLFDPDDDAFITLGDRFPFHRYLSSPDWRSVNLRKVKRLSALVAVANPKNLVDYKMQPLKRSRWARIFQDLTPDLEFAILPARDGMPLTISNLSGWLKQGFDVIYLVCHSATRNGDTRLFLEDEKGMVERVSGQELAQSFYLLSRQPRLVVLASDKTTPIALRLAELGVPAILANLGGIRIKTMEEFSKVFFRELLQDGRAERAASWARASVLKQSDWWSPVLYTRVRDGKLW